ncbi:hypothetical protein Fmac_020617 [Flemingia macrophylla]|uniref:Uncharacterized protein n=1 Tax=Flemingia macrophylla TaxID=520843 RepID=A0ABD1LUK7_9FABA
MPLPMDWLDWFMLCLYLVDAFCTNSGQRHQRHRSQATSIVTHGKSIASIGNLKSDPDHLLILVHGILVSVLIFLLGAMTIVEIVDAHQGFKLVTDNITTRSPCLLLWVLSIHYSHDFSAAKISTSNRVSEGLFVPSVISLAVPLVLLLKTRLEELILFQFWKEVQLKHIGDDMVLILGAEEEDFKHADDGTREEGIWSCFYLIQKWEASLIAGWRLAWLEYARALVKTIESQAMYQWNSLSSTGSTMHFSTCSASSERMKEEIFDDEDASTFPPSMIQILVNHVLMSESVIKPLLGAHLR